MRFIPSIIVVLLFISGTVNAQMQRTRAVQDGPVGELFLMGSIAGSATVSNLEAHNLNTSIQHNFGEFNGGIEDFWGLDLGAAVRLGIDYGISDKLSVGIGRTSVEDNVDLRFKYSLLRQLKSDKIPVEVAIKGDLGINTQSESRFDFTFTERLNYFGSVMVARQFSDKITLQVAPMISHFNTVVIETAGVTPENTIFALGLSGRFKLNVRNSLTFEYLPVLGPRNDGTYNHLAFGYEIETGGHVFQIFLMSGQWFTEQHLISRNTSDFFAGDFRLGFNVNRVFSLRKH